MGKIKAEGRWTDSMGTGSKGRGWPQVRPGIGTTKGEPSHGQSKPGPEPVRI